MPILNDNICPSLWPSFVPFSRLYVHLPTYQPMLRDAWLLKPGPKHSNRTSSTLGSWQLVQKCVIMRLRVCWLYQLPRPRAVGRRVLGQKWDRCPFPDSLCLYVRVCACREDRSVQNGKELKALQSTKSQAKELGKGILWTWLEELLQ